MKRAAFLIASATALAACSAENSGAERSSQNIAIPHTESVQEWFKQHANVPSVQRLPDGAKTEVAPNVYDYHGTVRIYLDGVRFSGTVRALRVDNGRLVIIGGPGFRAVHDHKTTVSTITVLGEPFPKMPPGPHGQPFYLPK